MALDSNPSLDLANHPGGPGIKLQIWLIVTSIAALRAFVEAMGELLNSHHLPILHIAAFASLLLVVFLIRRNRITNVSWAAGVFLLALLLILYFRFGGVEGTSEYDVMTLAVVFTLSYHGKEFVALVVTMLIVLSLINIDFCLEGPLSSSRLVTYTTGHITYLSTVITLVILIGYFKDLMVGETSELRARRNELNSLNQEVRKVNNELKSKKDLFQSLNSELSEKIEEHVDQIVARNQAIENYLLLSRTSLSDVLIKLETYANEISDNTFLESELKNQITELGSAIQRLNSHQRYEENHSEQ